MSNQIDFFEELSWRGMIHDFTPGVEEHLKSGRVTGYIGFDPTAPSLTIGNYVQIMLLTHLQRAGHQPIMLMGGATGRIGDPSGKDQERQLKTYDELDSNLNFQVEQAKKLLHFGDDGALLVNNYDFYKNMSALDFLRDVGKSITVNYMLSKESVQRRLETGISFTEFSYQLLQGYDYQCLFEQHNCTLQMGGSDQWGNILGGTEFVRRNLAKKVHALTTPLLLKSDGTKFGKSSTGNIWLDPKLTSPYQFYQFWLQADDADLPKFMRYFSLKTKQEIEAIEAEMDARDLKKVLSSELTARIHGESALASVQLVTALLFSGDQDPELLQGMSQDEFTMLAGEIPTAQLDASKLSAGADVCTLVSELTGLFTSKSEARRAVQNNAIKINKVKISDPTTVITSDSLLHGKYLMIENGKKNKHLVVVGS
jgi:tyrosyl-tRNA synthetase